MAATLHHGLQVAALVPQPALREGDAADRQREPVAMEPTPEERERVSAVYGAALASLLRVCSGER